MHVVIIGGGPAGVSAALYARRSGAEVTVVAKDGGSLACAEKIENYYGVGSPISGAELLRRGAAGARRLGVAFHADEVVDIQPQFEDGGFIVEGVSRTYTADTIVLATGARHSSFTVPGIKEFEGHGVSFCAVCDAFFYRGKRIAVIGAGAYALHEVQILLPHALQ